MMQNLGIGEGDVVRVANVSLQKGKYVKLQPQSVDFLDLTNPKAVLEVQLRNFACLTKGDVIRVMYLNKAYDISILETKPADAICIVEADVEVDFAAPLGYVEPTRPAPEPPRPEEVPSAPTEDVFRVRRASSRKSTQDEDNDDGAQQGGQQLQQQQQPGFVPFMGSGRTLSGKPISAGKPVAGPAGAGLSAVRSLGGSGGAGASLPPRPPKRSTQDDDDDDDDDEEEDQKPKFKPFAGAGHRLK
jgi:ubiquitin fusion degradation protein 1